MSKNEVIDQFKDVYWEKTGKVLIYFLIPQLILI